MDKSALSQHKATLDQAVNACKERSYWSQYSESPKAYGEGGQEAGEKEFTALLQKSFALLQTSEKGFEAGAEKSPFGVDLAIKYPALSPEALVANAKAAQQSWAKAAPEERALLCVEFVNRINKISHLMAYATMHTTGQPWMMSFQAGGPHAQDRALEAIAYGYSAMAQVPHTVLWEKPQGKQPPISLSKRYEIMPRGVALVIGCATFPNWNSYPGLFASLVCGNPVIVKPHPMAILPLALTVLEGQKLFKEAGYDPNLLQLAVDTVENPIAQKLATSKDVKIVDFTGGPVFGQWLEDNVKQAQLYTEKAGVNSVVIDSVADLDAMAKNLSLSVSLYSGQMCTAPQNIFIPAAGIETGAGKKSFDEVVAAITKAVTGLLGDDARAVEVLGAVQSPETIKRLQGEGKKDGVVLASRTIGSAKFPDAQIHTPVFVQVDAKQADRFGQEMFGPIVYFVKVADSAEGLKLASDLAKQKGAISAAVYSTSEKVQEEAEALFFEAGVNVSFNLTGNIFVNQNAAFSDFHVTGANPAGNASITDSAFVTNRFRVVSSRVMRPAAVADAPTPAANLAGAGR